VEFFRMHILFTHREFCYSAEVTGSVEVARSAGLVSNSCEAQSCIFLCVMFWIAVRLPRSCRKRDSKPRMSPGLPLIRNHTLRKSGCRTEKWMIFPSCSVLVTCSCQRNFLAPLWTYFISHSVHEDLRNPRDISPCRVIQLTLASGILSSRTTSSPLGLRACNFRTSRMSRTAQC
jgi:hypothetical protein